jgi:ABC-type antimicrobial peptide transport system permease subunit
MDSNVRRRLTTVSLSVLGALAGLVGAVIVTLNLHILVGLEDGYMAGPTQVLERSVWLLVMDAVILVAAPVLAVILVVRLRRSSSNSR